MKDHYYTINYGPYPVPLIYVPSKGAWKRARKANELPKYSYPVSEKSSVAGHCVNMRNNKGFACIVVFIRPDRPEADTVGTIVHEAVHVLQYIKEVIGEDEPGMEFEAYTTEAIVSGLITAYEDYHKKNLVVKPKKEKKK